MRIVPLLMWFYAFSSPTMVQEEFLQNQLLDCKLSLLEQVEQYILILPTELGCLPCQYIHAFWQSSKYNHIEKRKEQLTKVKNQLIKNNNFCAADLLKFVNEEMGDFNGEYGKKFFQSCTRKLENFIIIMRKALSVCTNPENPEKNSLCAICNTAPANMRFSCGHQLSCKQCEELRIYHRCLYCDKEETLEDIYCNSLLIHEPDCCVCFYPYKPLCYLDPCGHTHTCDDCLNALTDCPLCFTHVNRRNNIMLIDYEKICLLCNKKESNMVYNYCHHISSCIDCESKAEENICPKCKHNAFETGLRTLYF